MCPVEFARRCFWLSDFTTKRSRSMSWQNNNRDHQTQTWRHGRLNIRRLATKHPHKCNRLPKQVKHHDWIEATNTDMAKQFSGKRNVIRSRLEKKQLALCTSSISTKKHIQTNQHKTRMNETHPINFESIPQISVLDWIHVSCHYVYVWNIESRIDLTHMFRDLLMKHNVQWIWIKFKQSSCARHN